MITYIRSFQLIAGDEQVHGIIHIEFGRKIKDYLRNPESFSTQFSHYVCKRNRVVHFGTGWPISKQAVCHGLFQNEPNKKLFTN